MSLRRIDIALRLKLGTGNHIEQIHMSNSTETKRWAVSPGKSGLLCDARGVDEIPVLARLGCRASLLIIAWSAVVMFADHAGAQASPRAAILSGVVVDSLNGGFLQSAVIFVSGTSQSAVTNERGRFMLKGIPPGDRSIEVQHPLLDSLALIIATSAQPFAEGDSSFVVIAVPSAQTIVESSCSPNQRTTGSALVVGRVLDAESEHPSEGATVTASWKDYRVTTRSVSEVPHKQVTSVGSDGSYRLCGLPGDATVAVNASRGASATASLIVSLKSLVGIVSLRLPALQNTADTANASKANGLVDGKVIDENGNARGGARVSIEEDETATTSKADGSFRLAGVRPGTRALSVRSLGYDPIELPIDVSAGGGPALTVQLQRPATVLKAVLVKAVRDAGLVRVGFQERKRVRPGSFFTPEQVEARNSPPLSRLLETNITFKLPGCVRYYVDGHLWAQDTNVDDYLYGAEIGAVEVYSKMFSPPEFMSFRTTGEPCKTVVVWTKGKIGTL